METHTRWEEAYAAVDVVADRRAKPKGRRCPTATLCWREGGWPTTAPHQAKLGEEAARAGQRGGDCQPLCRAGGGGGRRQDRRGAGGEEAVGREIESGGEVVAKL